MTSPSKFDVDLTRIVKHTEEVTIYIVGDGLDAETFPTFEGAATSLTMMEIYHFLQLPPCMEIEDALIEKKYRDKIREVIDYLDRD